MNTSVTIITPTYNRAHTLKRCFESLQIQTINNFQWLIIDDGSTDNTKLVIEELKSSECKFKLDYFYKTNGGKHTALNFSHSYITGEVVLILDSDDYLTENAVEKILLYWSKYREIEDICGLSFLRGKTTEIAIGEHFPNNEITSDFITVRINNNVTGDKCEVLRTSVLKEFTFPVFDRERFFGEGYLWVSSALKYDMVFINEIIYIGEYLEGGLTKSGRILRLENPLGGMHHAKAYFNKKIDIKVRIKNYWLFICYGFCADISIQKMIKEVSIGPILINLPFGWILYKFWKKKY